MEEEETKEDTGWVDDGAEYSPKSEFSKPEVTEEAVKRCITLRAKEMKQGYFNTLFSKEGLPLKTWIEDSRKAYCSSVQALRSLLIPEVLGDDAYQKIDLEKIYKEYAYFELRIKRVGNRITYNRTEIFYIPEIDAKVNVKEIFPDGHEELRTIAGYWNPKVNAYWNDMVLKHDQIFEELMKVIHRLNYFKQQVTFG